MKAKFKPSPLIIYFMPRIYRKWIKIFSSLPLLYANASSTFYTVFGFTVNLHVPWIQANYGLFEELCIVLEIFLIFIEPYLYKTKGKML